MSKVEFPSILPWREKLHEYMNGITKTTVASIMAALVMAACSSGKQKPDFAAAEAAKEFYDSLNNGGYKYFTDMFFRTERIPDSYREQLETNSKMFIADLKKEHGALGEVRILDCKNDSRGENAEAYIMLCFADSVKEEIVVPMTKQNGKWMMK